MGRAKGEVPRGEKDNVLAAMERIRMAATQVLHGDRQAQTKILHTLESIEQGAVKGTLNGDEAIGMIRRAKSFARHGAKSGGAGPLITALDHLEERVEEYLSAMR